LTFLADSYAKAAAAVQMAAFRRWGVMADWQSGCYFTTDKAYEVNQLELFFAMYQKAGKVFLNKWARAD